jgi:replication factor C large subunit
MADWTETYRPTTLSEVRGNDKACEQLREWAETWDDHRSAVILHGSPGIGKTSAAHALAHDMGWPVMELNASDQRTGDDIERLAGGAAMNQSLTGTGRQLVILDEADNIHYQKDRGGAAAITRLVKEANQPIVLIANEFYDMSQGLRSACETIEFNDVYARSITPALRDICRQEGIEYEEAALEAIAEQNSGDLRGAVNDLQALAEGTRRLTEDDVVTAERDRTEDIFTLLDAVLKEQPPEEALRTAYDTDETPDDLLQWVEDKVPKVYEGGEIARAYEFLANADRWLGRVRATQNYSYWRYATDNVAAGVAAARDHERGGWTRYGGAPYRSSKDATRDYVAQRVAEVEGVSTATARAEILPFLAAMTHHCRNRELTVAMTARYDLDAEHVSFVTGSGKTTNKVQSIVEESEERKEADAVEHSGDAFAGSAGDGADAAGASEDDEDDAEEAPQATLGGDGAASEPTTDGVDDEEDESDDQQSGLGDFV